MRVPGRVGQIGRMSIAPRSGAAVDPWPLGALSSAAKASIVHLSAPVKLLETSSPLIRLRRQANNTARDWDAGPDGRLNTAEIIEWAAGSTLYKHRQYSQVGGTVHMVQDDITAQPVFDPLTEDDTYNGSANWMDITGCLTSSNILTAYPAVTFVSRAKRATGAGTAVSHRSDLLPVIMNTLNAAGTRAIQRTTSSSTRTLTDPAAVDTLNFHTIVAEFNFATGMMSLWVDGVAASPLAMDMTGTLTATKTTVGASFQPTAGTFLNGGLSGTAVFTSALSTADRNLITSVWNTL